MIKKRLNFISFFLLSALFTSLLVGMENAQQQETKKTELWNQLKQRVFLLKELKSCIVTKQPKVIATAKQQVPQNFIPQSIAHLKSMVGSNKQEKELIAIAVNDLSTRSASLLFNTISAKIGEQKLIPLAEKIINAEKKYKDYYVFYHGQEGALIIIHDIMQAFYAWFGLENPTEQTHFLRLFTSPKENLKNVDALVEYIYATTPSNEIAIEGFDHTKEAKKNLLSANVSLFGNIGMLGDNTWSYFITSKSIEGPILKDQLAIFFDFFGFNKKFIDNILEIHSAYLQALTEKVLTPQEARGAGEIRTEIVPGTLLQLFIHPSVVDEIAYLADPFGLPFDFNKKCYITLDTKLPPKQAQAQLDQLKRNIFSSELNKTSINNYLHLLRTKPEEIDSPIINEAQARLYLKYSIFTDPEKIKIFAYKAPSFTDNNYEKAEKEYKQKLALIIEEIIKEWLFQEKDLKREKTRIEYLFELLKIRKEKGSCPAE